MQIAVSEVVCDGTKDRWTLHHLTDLHIDEPDHASEELAKKIKTIKDDPKALWVGGGDYGGLILPGDPRWQGEEGDFPVARMPDWYVDTVTDMLYPIRDKCVGFGVGNHEITVMKKWHRGVAAEVANNLSMTHMYLGVRGWAIIRFHNKSRKTWHTLKIYQYHGWSAGRGRGRKSTQAEKDLGSWDADIFLVGHDHAPDVQIWYTESLYKPSRGKKWKVRQTPRCFMNGGAMLYGQRQPESYVGRDPKDIPTDLWKEGKNYRPQPPVSPTLDICLDFGTGRDTKCAYAGRPMSFDFEARWSAPTFYFDD